MRKMMAYKPEDRPTPEELLEDPWFAPVGIDTTAEQEQVQVQVWSPTFRVTFYYSLCLPCGL